MEWIVLDSSCEIFLRELSAGVLIFQLFSLKLIKNQTKLVYIKIKYIQ
jgi:hypothetical protein